MSTLRLPVFPAEPDYRYAIQLDGETFTLEHHYNARADRFNVHVFDAAGDAVKHGARLVNGTDLLELVALDTKPPGQLTVVDTTEAELEPTLATLGEECQLRYIEADDL